MCIDARESKNTPNFWRREESLQPSFSNAPVWRPDLLATIESTIDSLNKDLRQLSLNIHNHPEIGFQEHHAHDVLTDFMAKQGFEVKKHYILPTAWVATFKQGQSGRTLGVNSEMDALPGIGHACGHNLIAIAGVAIACAAKAALTRHNIPGTIVLLGTPAEEAGGGKVILLEAGAYESMDACIMCHPAPGPNSSSNLGSSLSRRTITVEFSGQSAHAAFSPWEGQNALDAAVVAYNGISVLRQQLHPSVRVHGIFQGEEWSPNVIPDNAKMIWYVRASTWDQVEKVTSRVVPCFEAAALATGCKVQIKFDKGGSYYDLRQNAALGDAFEKVFSARYGSVNQGIEAAASTDFGNVTYALPGLHPIFAIPTEPDGGNHTPAFAHSAATIEAHEACLNTSKALSAAGIRVIVDDGFYAEVFAEPSKAECGNAHGPCGVNVEFDQIAGIAAELDSGSLLRKVSL